MSDVSPPNSEITHNIAPAARMRRLREHLGLSQRDLAHEFQVAPGAIAMWESGERPLQGPSLKLLEIFEDEIGLAVSKAPEDFAELEALISSRFGRNLNLTKLASKAASIWLFDLTRSLLSTGSARSHIQKRATLKLAAQVVQSFSEMKGLPMKLGQIISYHDVPLSEEVRQLFESLQTSGSVLSVKTVNQIIKKEFGTSPKEIFAKWSSTPFAAASIGQVHLARLASGENVAVKIQYPEIARAIRSDLKNVESLAKLLAPFMGPSDMKAIVAELGVCLRAECDYQKEKETQDIFGRMFHGRKEIIVPKTIPEFCRKNILCSELISGLSFQDFLKQSTQGERNRAGETIWQFSFESMFWGGWLNADPHPGNYLFQDGAVAFLDYGCAKKLSDEFLQSWRSIFLNTIRGKREAVVETLSDLGMFPTGKVDRDQLNLILDSVYAPFLKDEMFINSDAHVRRAFQVWFADERSRKSFKFPSEWVFLTRILFGLSSVLVRLRAESNWHRRILDILERDDLCSASRLSLARPDGLILPRSSHFRAPPLTL